MDNTENTTGLRLRRVTWVEEQYPKARCDRGRYAYIGRWPLLDADAVEHYVDVRAFDEREDGSLVAAEADTLPVMKAVRGDSVVDPITRIIRRRWQLCYLDMPYDDVCAMALLAETADVPEGRGMQALAEARAAKEADESEGAELGDADALLEELLAGMQGGPVVGETDELGLIVPDAIPGYLLGLVGRVE